MLERSFFHIPKIGAQTEMDLWRQGCDSWQTFLDAPDRFRLGQASLEDALPFVEDSQAALLNGDGSYFAPILRLAEAWRAWPAFRDRAVMLDIETDGGQSGQAITIIGLSDREGFTGLVKGQDLEEFPDRIAEVPMIVTFYGAGFDVPMLQKRFPSVRFDRAIHFDLCFAFKKVGVKGGLKKIERDLGLDRSDETAGLSGLDAIRLWRMAQAGRDGALETLLQYNKEDVVNLWTLADICYERIERDTFLKAGLSELVGSTFERSHRLF